MVCQHFVGVLDHRMKHIPNLLNSLSELRESMHKVHKFLQMREIQTTVKRENCLDMDDVALELKGNFSWGFKNTENKEHSDSEDE